MCRALVLRARRVEEPPLYRVRRLRLGPAPDLAPVVGGCTPSFDIEMQAADADWREVRREFDRSDDDGRATTLARSNKTTILLRLVSRDALINEGLASNQRRVTIARTPTTGAHLPASCC